MTAILNENGQCRNKIYFDKQYNFYIKLNAYKFNYTMFSYHKKFKTDPALYFLFCDSLTLMCNLFIFTSIFLKFASNFAKMFNYYK